MKVRVGQPAPDFTAQDAFGKTVRLSDYRGRKVFLVFFRVVGCPTCHFTMRQIQKANALRTSGLVFLAIYQSSPEMLRTYLNMEGGAANLYGTLIGDAPGQIYDEYEVESSTAKLMSGLLFHGGFKTFTEGGKLFAKKIKDEGHTNRQGAEFLIDENGIVAAAHYGSFSGDFIALDDVHEFSKKKAS